MNSTRPFPPRVAALIAVAVVICLVVTGCGNSRTSSDGTTTGSKPTPGGTLNVSNGEENTTLNPLTAYTLADVAVISNIFETPFKENFKGEIVPWLVEKYEPTDHYKVTTLKLRKGVQFSNGKPMTSADVKFSMEKVKESELYGALLEQVTEISAPDPQTVVLKSTVPEPELPLIFSLYTFGIMPKNFGGVSEKEFQNHPVGTGPFMFASWKKGEALTLDKNPHYWKSGRPYLDQVVFHNVEDPNSRVSQLQAGQLDAVNAPPAEQLAALESNPETEVQESEFGLDYLLVLNSRRPPFDNIKLREAVNIALDREGIIQTALDGHGEPAGSFVSPPVFGFSEAIKPAEQDAQKAKSLVAEAEKEGVNPTVEIMVVNETPFWVNASQVIQQNLQDVGFTVSLRKADASTVANLGAEGNFDALTTQNFFPDESSSEAFTFYNSFEGNWSGSPTDETKRLLPDAEHNPNEKAREQRYEELLRIVQKEQSLVFIAYAPFIWATGSDVSGFFIGKGGTPWFGETGLTH